MRSDEDRRVDAVSISSMSELYTDLGNWVRKTDYQLTKDEWHWLNSSRMDILRRQAAYSVTAFGGVFALTSVRFTLNGGPMRRMPGWSRWATAGTAAWMASGLAKLGGHRASMKRLLHLPESELANHMRTSLDLPLPAPTASADTAPALMFAEPGMLPPLDQVTANRSRAELESAGARAAGRLAAAAAAQDSSADVAVDAGGAFRERAAQAVEPRRRAPPGAPDLLQPAASAQNSWDRVRQQRQQLQQQAAADGQLADGAHAPARARAPAAHTAVDGSVESGQPRVISRKNRWGDQIA
jgi:hypothetical protein